MWVMIVWYHYQFTKGLTKAVAVAILLTKPTSSNHRSKLHFHLFPKTLAPPLFFPHFFYHNTPTVNMDLFAADHVAPFPDSGDLLYATDLLSHRHNPQKLRPIRSIPPADSSHTLDPPEPSPQLQDPPGSGSGHAHLPPAQDSG